jgi:Uma2 family endonuclease
MATSPTPVMTVDEYFELPESNSRIDELLDGAYVITPTPAPRHALGVQELGFLLRERLTDPAFEVFPIPGNLVLGPRTVATPDLFVIPRPRSSGVSWREVGRPVLVAEFPDPNTAARDRGVKRLLYQQAGVPEYWIVDLDSRLVERWRPEDERPEVLRESLSWQPPGSSSSIVLDLSEFFAEVVDR